MILYIYPVFYCACSTETCEKGYLCQGSPWAKSLVVFRRLTQNPRLALLTEMPTHAYTGCRAWAVSAFAISLCTDPVREIRARKVSWLGTLGAHLSAHVTRDKKNLWNPGTVRRCLGSRTYNALRRCVSRRFWLAFPCDFAFFPLSFLANIAEYPSKSLSLRALEVASSLYCSVFPRLLG